MFKKDFTHKTPRLKTAHVFLSRSTQNKVFWNALNFQIPKKDTKMVIENNDEIDADYRFGCQFNYSGQGYNEAEINHCIDTYFQDKNTEYIFYLTDRWANGLVPFLRRIPKEKIKAIHVYEESIGDLLTKDYKKFLISPEQFIKMIYDDSEKKPNPIYQYAFHTLYPTVYHIGFKDYIFNNFEDLKNYFKGTLIEDMDFYKLRDSLPYKIKKKVFRHFEFNPQKYKKLIGNRQVNLFVVGHGIEGYQRDIIKNEALLIQAIKEWYAKSSQIPNQLSFIKLGRNTAPFFELLKKNQLNIPIFPYEGPFEILILADLIPDTVSGTDCSLYANLLDKNIGIMYENRHWTILLKKINKLSDQQIHTANG